MVTALNRVPEPAVEDASAEAEVYDKMDHTAVNEAFCVDLLAAVETAGLGPKLHDGVDPLRLLDVGTGTARIPIMLARRPIFLKPIVVEPDEAMLNRARLNMYASGLQANIDLRAGAAGSLEFEDGAFDAVMSNSVLHHMDDVTAGLADMVRVLRPGGLLFVRDLARPASEEDVTELVTRHAAGEPEAAKTLLEQS
ncbi:MAG: class I SAM-dependent methyltransferase, partial [Planctomycetota bacterium]